MAFGGDSQTHGKAFHELVLQPTCPFGVGPGGSLAFEEPFTFDAGPSLLGDVSEVGGAEERAVGEETHRDRRRRGKLAAVAAQVR